MSPGESTPILDRVAPLPPPVVPRSGTRWILGASIAIAIAIAIAVPAVLTRWDPALLETGRRWILAHFPELFPDRWSASRLLGIGVQLLLVMPLAIAIHESGHLLAGLAAGFRFSELRIGPLQIDRPFRISWQKSPGTGYAGWASMFPRRRDKLRIRALAFVAGGPGINILSAGVVLLLPGPKGFASALFVAVSLGLALKELIPIRHPFAIRDGRRILLLVRNREWSGRWLAIMKLGTELKAGVLPEALSADWLAEAVGYVDDSPDTVSAHGIAYAAAFHQHRDGEAGRWLETALRHAGFAAPAQREALMSESAVFQARRRGRADLADAWLADLPRSTRTLWLRSRAEAAILEARGDVEGALKKLEDVEREVRDWPDVERRELTLRLLERWRTDLRGRPSRSPAPSPGGSLA